MKKIRCGQFSEDVARWRQKTTWDFPKTDLKGENTVDKE